jgi:protein gp37
VPADFIARVWSTMARCPQHTFQILTKRPQRMAQVLPNVRTPDGEPALLPNVWLGTSVENQRYADLRIPHLLATPAAVRFLSVEPMLSAIDLTPWLSTWDVLPVAPMKEQEKHGLHNMAVRHADGSWEPNLGGPALDRDEIMVRTGRAIDWVIVGGESGPGARPMHPQWARDIRDQCIAAGVPFFFKQWGEWAPDPNTGTHLLQVDGGLVDRADATMTDPYGHGTGVQDLVDRGHAGWVRVRRVGKKSAGRVLDGRTWDEMP